MSQLNAEFLGFPHLTDAEYERLCNLQKPVISGIYDRVRAAHESVPHRDLHAGESCTECGELEELLLADAGLVDPAEEDSG